MDRLLKQNAEIARAFIDLNKEKIDLQDIIDSGMVEGKEKVIEYENGCPILENSVEVQVGKSFISQNNEAVKRQCEEMKKREVLKRKKQEEIKSLLLADSSKVEPVAKLVKKKDIKSKIIGARKSLTAMKKNDKKLKKAPISRQAVLLSPVKSSIDLRTSGLFHCEEHWVIKGCISTWKQDRSLCVANQLHRYPKRSDGILGIVKVQHHCLQTKTKSESSRLF